MSRMPGAVFDVEHGSEAMSRHDIVCVHTIVGTAPATAAHFSTAADGTIHQSRDTKFKSAANLSGNHRIIAIENEDRGSAFGAWDTSDGHAVPAFTPQQLDAIAKILAWAHKEHGIPLQLCPDSKPTSRGLAYHRQGIDGNFGPFRHPGRVEAGEQWSGSFGKVCPGDRRIDQLTAILEKAREIVEGGFDEVATKAEIKEAVREVVAEVVRDELTKQRKMLTDGGDGAGNVNKERNNLQNIRELITESTNDIIAKLG
ncbi:MAG TPA: N-acetylmuramoyl-L-alanine amidase [Actinomycetota bacterium]|nr:N-acetylmuramoyl-L-alanine amidase [Actinomycetota bacterium]